MIMQMCIAENVIFDIKVELLTSSIVDISCGTSFGQKQQ